MKVNVKKKHFLQLVYMRRMYFQPLTLKTQPNFVSFFDTYIYFHLKNELKLDTVETVGTTCRRDWTKSGAKKRFLQIFH